MSNRVLAIAVALLSVAVIAKSSAAKADGFDARPVTIETRDGLGAVVITNPGDRKIYLETQVFDWTQDTAGHDLLTESTTAIASPPAMWVAPHSTYNLRVRLPGGEAGQERAFRVMIKQLPSRSDIVAGHIVFALTQSLPAFVEAEDMRPAMLNGRVSDPRHILIVNNGGRRARIANITQDGRTVASGLVGYALQHSALAVLLPAPVHPGAIEIQTDAGSRSVRLQ